MQSIRNTLQSWSQSTDERTKLQQAYLVAAVVLVILAGVVGLVNYNLGQQIVLLALVAGSIFIINAVAWALLQSFILLHIDRDSILNPKPSNTPKATTKEATKSKTTNKTSIKK